MIDGPRLAPASGGRATSLVVFLHGYGADGNDLIGIGREWQHLLPETAFVAPHAPDRLAGPDVPPGIPGRRWFALTMRDPGEYRAGVAAALPVLEEFLDHEAAYLGLEGNRIALVGFSQGTMMALAAGPRRRLAGIVGYSGLLADPEAWKAEGAARPPVLLVHGDADELIPVQALFAAIAGLGGAEVALEWHVSAGLGHGIDADGLSLGGAFLRRVLCQPVSG